MRWFAYILVDLARRICKIVHVRQYVSKDVMTCETTNIPAPKPPNMTGDYFNLVTDRRIILRGIIGGIKREWWWSTKRQKRRDAKEKARA
jgi:hypothetical protein